ncbi:hypothetical protein V501_09207, partial [Pseudogymnoascus sp. VKM F-4519 (FW-2642)]
DFSSINIYLIAPINFWFALLQISTMSSTTKPTILLVPGLWEGPTVFAQVSTLLEYSGYSTQTASLPSTGSLSPGNPNMNDDILSIRVVISQLVQSNKEVLLVLHSAGGFLASEAMEGLSVKKREEAGLKGGVSGIVFLAAGLARVGDKHVKRPFMDTINAPKGGMFCINPRESLFNDISDQEAEKWMKRLKTQPAEDWNGVTQYCGWEDVPSTYLVCEKDELLPAEVQVQMAQMAESNIEKCEAGHMVMLSMPKRVVEVIRGVAGG